MKSIEGAKFILDMFGASFGLLGTWMMSRRYAKELGRSFIYALAVPVLMLMGKGERARSFVRSKIDGNRELPDSVVDMALGVMLLFWAFLFQSISLLLGRF